MALPKFMRRFPAYIHPPGNPDLHHEPGKTFCGSPVKDVCDQVVGGLPVLSVPIDVGKERAKSVEFNDDV